jgi:hypothetical protein
MLRGVSRTITCSLNGVFGALLPFVVLFYWITGLILSILGMYALHLLGCIFCEYREATPSFAQRLLVKLRRAPARSQE